ncbi:hypothetical protein DFH08DRAFT_952622 [Mycena albidolilacea]|uniref:Uncharacterized protein n=1 Tax=Mycena albidolilacea TaxID=1033008 RepID=A0AAD7AI38_9AGAR|nr:hypothetical protein DFH08DRAFT_952622 [Mycena albidolilacea]
MASCAPPMPLAFRSATIFKISTPPMRPKSGPSTSTGTLAGVVTPVYRSVTLSIPFLQTGTNEPYVHSVMDIQHHLFLLRTNSRVIFEGNKAVGVAYVPARNRAHQGKSLETIVEARNCVVISSGLVRDF